jgi:hypothetical protein
MKTNVNFQSYFFQFSVEWEMFQIKFTEKIKKHFFNIQ